MNYAIYYIDSLTQPFKKHCKLYKMHVIKVISERLSSTRLEEELLQY